jgi:hypothetical protein
MCLFFASSADNVGEQYPQVATGRGRRRQHYPRRSRMYGLFEIPACLFSLLDPHLHATVVILIYWCVCLFSLTMSDRNSRLKQAKLDASTEIAQYREMKERKFAQAESQAVRVLYCCLSIVLSSLTRWQHSHEVYVRPEAMLTTLRTCDNYELDNFMWIILIYLSRFLFCSIVTCHPVSLDRMQRWPRTWNCKLKWKSIKCKLRTPRTRTRYAHDLCGPAIMSVLRPSKPLIDIIDIHVQCTRSTRKPGHRIVARHGNLSQDRRC